MSPSLSGAATIPALAGGTQLSLTVADIFHAQRVIYPSVVHTPLMPTFALSVACHAHVYVKAENLQRTRSFKIRGATNKLAQLSPEQRAHGVVTASRGNHAQGVALAAQVSGSSAVVVMPTDAEPLKIAATQRLGAQVILHGATMSDASVKAREIAQQSGRTFVSAFDDPAVIAGQGTIGLEILSVLPDVDAILVPVGGGGLISGIALAVKTLKPETLIIGVQAKQMPSMRVSLEAGHPMALPPAATRGDGINVNSPSERTLALVQRYVDDVVEVDEAEMAQAMVNLYDTCNLVVEGAGAVGIAALLNRRVNLTGKQVVAVLSGGNVELSTLVSLRQ